MCLEEYGSHAIQEGIQMLRCLMCFLCLIVFSGPVLFLFGIFIIASPNTRESDIATYNAAVDKWSQGDQTVMAGSTFKLLDVPMSMYTESVSVLGNNDGVKPATSVYFSNNNAARASTYTITTKDNKGITNTLSTKFTTTTNQCYCYFTYNDCPSDYREGYNSYGSYGSCTNGMTCGTCKGTRYLSNVCSVVDYNAGVAFGISNSKSSCTYPFTSQQYSTSSFSSVAVSARASTDPYVALSQVTKGKMDFGLTQAEQYKLGLGFVISGSFCMLLVFGGCFYLCCNPTKKQQFGNMYNNAMGQPVVPMQTMPMSQPLMVTYPQQQPQQQQPYYSPQQQQYIPPQQQAQYPPQQQQQYVRPQQQAQPQGPPNPIGYSPPIGGAWSMPPQASPGKQLPAPTGYAGGGIVQRPTLGPPPAAKKPQKKLDNAITGYDQDSPDVYGTLY